MANFAKSLRAPRTFTREEARRLLDASGRYAADFRDHMIFSVAFGTGLRVHEVAALEVGDIFTANGGVRTRVRLRVFKGSDRAKEPQEIRLPGALLGKLAKFRQLKAKAGEPLDDHAPLFTGRKGGHLTDRHCRRLLKKWLEEAGLDVTLHFHELRHAAITDYYSRNPDPAMAQAFARHRDIRTTMRYVHMSEERMATAIQGQIC
jgi:integrase/recombinase XerC